MPKRKPQLPATEEVLAAMGQHALKGKQGRVAAGRAYLDHVAGRPVQKNPHNELHISEEVARRLADIAERMIGPCPQCGYGEPKPSAQATATFPAFTPPEPAKAPVVEADERPAVPMRQPRGLIENSDPLRDTPW